MNSISKTTRGGVSPRTFSTSPDGKTYISVRCDAAVVKGTLYFILLTDKGWAVSGDSPGASNASYYLGVAEESVGASATDRGRGKVIGDVARFQIGGPIGTSIRFPAAINPTSSNKYIKVTGKTFSVSSMGNRHDVVGLATAFPGSARAAISGVVLYGRRLVNV